MAACGHALDGNHPTFMQQIPTRDQAADHRKNRREESKRRQQLLNEVELRGPDDCQEPPHPLSAFVCLFHIGSFLGLRSRLLTSCLNPFVYSAQAALAAGFPWVGCLPIWSVDRRTCTI
jgi:hypothetical protein